MALVAVRAVKEGAVSRLSRATYANSTSTHAETRRLAWLDVGTGSPNPATAELQRLYWATWVAARESGPAGVSTVWWDARAAAYVRGAADAHWSWRVLALARRWRTVAALRRDKRPTDAHGRARAPRRQTQIATHEEATGMQGVA